MAEVADAFGVSVDGLGSRVCGEHRHDAITQNPKERKPIKSDRDSDIHLSDAEDSQPQNRSTSISSTHALSSRSTPQRTGSIARLQRPAELNLGFCTTNDPSKPRSELDLRFDLIRNSQNRNKASLRSPTQLLKNRLNLSPTKTDHAERVRTFVPPEPVLNGCILPGPAGTMKAFTGWSVRARIEKSGRPAWWCKFDKFVVFDGTEQCEGKIMTFKTRTSKGLSIARRKGDIETVVIPLDCSHCQEMLNRSEWKYDVQICKRGVCWDCTERCRWEMEQEAVEVKDQRTDEKTDANRARADSVLQDDNVQEEGPLAKVNQDRGIEAMEEAAGGIEERSGGDPALGIA